MKCVWFIIFWLNWSFAAVGSTLLPPISTKITRLEARKDPIPVNATTTPAPIEAPTALVEVINNKTANSTAMNNKNFYDHNHQILLVVLSDLKVREARDGQQSKKPVESNNAKKEVLNETLILDEKRLKDLLTKLHPTIGQDVATNGEKINKCVNIVPHYVPPTFPWLLRKQQSKPIIYMEPTVCENTAKVGGIASLESKSRKRRPTDPIKMNIAHPRSRPFTSGRKRQRSRTADYVLVPRFGATQEMTHLKYPLNYFHNNDYAPLATETDFVDPWADYSSEDNEY